MSNEQEQRKLLEQTLDSLEVPKKHHEALLHFIQSEKVLHAEANLHKMLIAASQVLEEKHRFTHEMATGFVQDTTAVFVATELARLKLDEAVGK